MNQLSYISNELTGTSEPRIAALLESDAIDLAGISHAIREQPGLQRLVLTMSESLALAPGVPLGTVEEAAVVLGKNRLRVLVRAWELSRARTDGPLTSMPACRDASPEILYLASFFRWLGLDRSVRGNSYSTRLADYEPDDEAGEVGGLTDLLMRDVVSLIPYVEPVLLNTQPKAVPEGYALAREERTE
jgi:hypothetical protein